MLPKGGECSDVDDFTPFDSKGCEIQEWLADVHLAGNKYSLVTVTSNYKQSWGKVWLPFTELRRCKTI